MKARLFLLLLMLSPAPLLAADDWPCLQPLVPSVSMEMVWNGPPLAPAADWRADAKVAELVQAISQQETDAEEGNAKLKKFLEGRKQNRAKTVGRIMTGLVEENNEARARVIEHLKMLGERQKGLADVVAKLNDERDRAGSGADQELVDRATFAQRTYYETQRTLRYACEIPGRLDQRLGLYAKTLENAR
jgi:hypothetical protein